MAQLQLSMEEAQPAQSVAISTCPGACTQEQVIILAKAVILILPLAPCQASCKQLTQKNGQRLDYRDLSQIQQDISIT